jgi:hypothetical protein
MAGALHTSSVAIGGPTKCHPAMPAWHDTHIEFNTNRRRRSTRLAIALGDIAKRRIDDVVAVLASLTSCLVLAYKHRRNSIMAALTSGARSCWVQCPQPGSLIACRSFGTIADCFVINWEKTAATKSRSPAM